MRSGSGWVAAPSTFATLLYLVSSSLSVRLQVAELEELLFPGGSTTAGPDEDGAAQPIANLVLQASTLAVHLAKL